MGCFSPLAGISYVETTAPLKCDYVDYVSGFSPLAGISYVETSPLKIHQN